MFNTLNLRKFLLLAGDIFLLYLSLAAALFLGFRENFDLETLQTHMPPFSILFCFWLIILYVLGLYDFRPLKSSFSFYVRVSAALALSLGIGMIFFYLIPYFNITPKTNLLLNVLIFGFLFFAWRKFFYSIFSNHLLNKVAIMGTGSQAKLIAKEIAKNPYLGYKLKVLFKTDKSLATLSLPDVKVLNIEKNFLSQLKKEKIDTLILATDQKTSSRLLQNLYQYFVLQIDLMDFNQAYEAIFGKIPISFVNQLWFLENLKEGKKQFYEKIKGFFDFCLALALLVISFPLWMLISLFIKLEDNGPVFYCQQRIGKNKKPFSLIKFRSMKKNAEKEKAVWAKKNDSRATKIGNLLRKTHIDELPQMFNILKGEISLVGPRPERPEFVEKLEKEIPYYDIRHLVKPGFTGWAQIKFRYARSVIDSFEKFQYDLYYLKNRSLIFDIKILIKTLGLFFKKGN